MVAQSKVGMQIPLTIMRSGKEYALNVTTSELPKDVSETAPGKGTEDTALEGLAGLNVIELTREISRQLGLPRDEKGVVVVRVEPGSSVEDAGLRKGDVIQEIDRKKIAGLDDYTRIVAAIHSGDTVLMFINRDGKKFYVTVKAD
jgi:serine protease Do